MTALATLSVTRHRRLNQQQQHQHVVLTVVLFLTYAVSVVFGCVCVKARGLVADAWNQVCVTSQKLLY